MLKSGSYTGAHCGSKVVNDWSGQRPSGNFGGKSLSKNQWDLELRQDGGTGDEPYPREARKIQGGGWEVLEEQRCQAKVHSWMPQCHM